MLDEEMKNSRMLWKVRDRENGERSMACQKKKKYSLEVLPVKSWVEESSFPQTPKHGIPLISIQLLPMSKCFHGSLYARHVVSALKSLLAI